jgi:hypothetical protein
MEMAPVLAPVLAPVPEMAMAIAPAITPIKITRATCVVVGFVGYDKENQRHKYRNDTEKYEQPNYRD